jgi:hypothetical protein
MPSPRQAVICHKIAFYLLAEALDELNPEADSNPFKSNVMQ